MDTTRRFANRDKDYPCKGADGSKQCRWCGKPLRVGFYCGPECKREVDVRCGWDLPHYVFRRDRGVCADCRLDCVELERALDELRDKAKGQPGGYGVWRSFMAGAGIPYDRRWHIHHIRPVHEGGGCCGMDNLVTLCWRCHVKRHATDRREAAENRRDKRLGPRMFS